MEIRLTANDGARFQVAVGALAQAEGDSALGRWGPLDICGLASSEGETLGDFEGVGARGLLGKDCG